MYLIVVSLFQSAYLLNEDLKNYIFCDTTLCSPLKVEGLCLLSAPSWNVSRLNLQP
jgi:hypothetical protein